MQLSVIPHLTIYGDVKESDLKKQSFIKDKLGLLSNNPKQTTAKKDTSLVKAKLEVMKQPEVRADLIKASG